MHDQETSTEAPSQDQFFADLNLNSFDKVAIAIDRPLKFGGWVAKLAITGIAAGLGTLAVSSIAEKIQSRRQKKQGTNVLNVAGQ